MSVTVSIIICTRNRAESLRSTLASIGQVVVPEPWTVELLVVDHSSTDRTRVVVDETKMSNVNLRYVSKPPPGLSNARNTGIRETSGEVILFTDDDIRVPRNWIEGMCSPILRGEADAVAGGVVFPPQIEDSLKTRLPEKRLGWVAASRELDPNCPARMVGANMAFHRRVLEKVPGFDEELGTGQGAMGNGEDVLFSWQLLEAGYKLVSAFDVAVEHHFDVERLTPDRLLGLARNIGRSHAYIFHHWQHQRSRLVVPRLILCHLRRYCLRQLGQNKLGDDGVIPDKVLALEEELAFYREYLVQRNRPPKYSRRESL